ncbi:SusD/RagB family nutrient-binding outer membrane lipoprotein [Aliifodinibius sp. S!AR15-10]|uniref:SusD/RagB family nutrient-binding outer membrane lipoprotein n=1 Tax=Aliifodinibius sp. S!AR15-10 TaxID=2950437 RepID=UPI00285669E4|nr:SusD/RagB family nutrient-binding outer membrane lipoprotein [Aliifodinibius sp. S!AR15-10]MDR8394411.1 SusD/RagB family nutrient-binding outer membrane lipoprotein [Aliifodinibius sp. S!AR15-10]
MNFFKLISSTLLVAAIVLVGACENFLDVNEDPTSPTQVPPNLQLSSLLGNFSYEIVGNEPARVTTLWIQQTAYNGVPPSDDNYDYTSTGPDNMWGASYIDVLNNAKELNTQATEQESYAYSGIAKLVMAWNYSILTDLFNDIPRTEALDPLNGTPVYDSQQEVYTAILDLIDQAIEDFGRESVNTPTSDDLLYGGDMEKWEKLAYTLKARIYIHLTEAPDFSASEQANLALDALSNGFTGNSDDADFQYFNVTGEENPWYQFAIDGKWDTRNQLSDNYVSLLESLNDPRLQIQARPAGAVDQNGLVDGFSDDTPEYIGHVNGEDGIGAENVSSIGSFYSAANAPLNWLSYAEAKFIEAEATFITSGATAAQSIYEDAIRASMNKLGVEESDADTYIASLPGLTSSNALEEIITQKYIANFLSYEAYNDWRRTGYPEVTPITNDPFTPNGNIPLRFPYPQSEYNNNQSNVETTGVPNNYQALEQTVWWDAN